MQEQMDQITDSLKSILNESVEKLRNDAKQIQRFKDNLIDKEHALNRKEENIKNLNEALKKREADLERNLKDFMNSLSKLKSDRNTFDEDRAKLDENISKNNRTAELLKKQKSDLDERNKRIISTKREQEMESRRLKSLQIYINKVIEDRNLSKAIKEMQ